MAMPSVPELLILGVCLTLICIEMRFRPKQPDPTRVKNPEKLMWIGMSVSCSIGLASYYLGDLPDARNALPVIFCAQVMVYERAKRAIQALKQENASLKSGLASLGPQQNSEGIVEGSK